MLNRLASETSPYLLQHASNPVEWWPWCDDALALARRSDRPILLSIGYSACHWCHVMAHESFEDAEVAAVMNRLFVNIKVDREERPDLDQIYQTAHQVLTRRSGGWPLTMFLTPDGTPFFAGTYFPRQPRHGLPGFPALLERVGAVFREQRAALEEQNETLRAALARSGATGGAVHHSEFGPEPLAALRDQLSASFDEHFGGFGEAPKFPHPTDLEFLLRRFSTTGDERARDIVVTTLARMGDGGIFDQLGGGFCRYSTDERWGIPHFEKMLYDNGALLGLYALAWQLDADPHFRHVAEGVVGWVMREMQSPEGGYYAALDADSEGAEGRYYVWDRSEIRALLDETAYSIVERHYGLELAPNFEGRDWHLCVVRPLGEVAGELGLAFDEATARLADARAQLLEARERRVRPERDTKILTAWNALMIAGMARAARVFARRDWLASARRALDCLRQESWRDGRLYATAAGGSSRLNAYLDDHSFLIDALIELMQADFDPEDLAFAEELADALLESFEDVDGGGFFFTRHDHEVLIQRPKPLHDAATPSGNGVAARALGRLGHLTGEKRYLDAAERTVRAFYRKLRESPAGCATLATALCEQLQPPGLVVLRGAADELEHWKIRLARRFSPHLMVVAIPEGTGGLPPVLDKPAKGRVNAWVCRGVECLKPVDDYAELEALLRDGV